MLAMSDGMLRTASMTQHTWGQIVVGPPGAGKTTYCQGMQMFMEAIEREAIVVNLDPANKDPPYTATVDISELITVEEVMETLELGPYACVRKAQRFSRMPFDWWPCVLFSWFSQARTAR